MNKPLFNLEKWFLDVVDSDNRTSIFYAAKLNWLGVRFQYVDWIHYDGDNICSQEKKFRRVSLPSINRQTILWEDLKLNIKGEWTSMDNPINACVYDSPKGQLNWHCYQPRSHVKLNINNQEIEGLGYVEKLVLTAYPWHIPMDHLRWGRFVSPRHSLVWIELRESVIRQWVWLDGAKIKDRCEINDISVANKTFTLTLNKEKTLESGRSISKALGVLLKGVLNFNNPIRSNFANAYSQKWLSHGQLKIDNEIDQGMVIHEWVNFC